ncbi:MAG: serine/threonine-protein kinase, partial [Planctomycetota bacterium]
MDTSADDAWEAYRRARELEPTLTPAEFARRLGGDPEECDSIGVSPEDCLELLRLGEALERMRPGVPLVDLGADGTSFAGFVLLRELGRGAFGIVYEARRPDADAKDTVALKILNPLATADPGRQRELLREAALAQRLEHPAIVRVLASGVDRGYAWFASERVDGVPLDRLPRLPPGEQLERALGLGLQLAGALAHAHESGVIHRDLKPSNVLARPDGSLVVLDLGLAHAERVGASIRLSGEFVGTPLFMAPEQLSGRSVGPWTDVWGIGLLLLELAAPGSLKRAEQQLARGPRSPRRQVRVHRRALREVPAALRAVVRRCLAGDARDRYSTARSLEEDLRALVDGRARPHKFDDGLGRGRRALRRRAGSLAWALSLASIGALAYEWIWMARVPVRLETFDEAKALRVDGRSVGVSPVTVALRPGTHFFEVTESGPTNRGATYQGTFDVRRGARSQDIWLPLDWDAWLPVLRPSDDPHQRLLGELRAIPPGSGAWLVVAARPEAAGFEEDRTGGLIRVEGLSAGGRELPAVFRTRVPLGEVAFTLSATGHATREVTLDVERDRLYFVAEALEPLGADGRAVHRTQVLYSFLDDDVEAALAAGSTENLRPYVEHQPFDGGLSVAKAYLGLADGQRP